MTKKKIRVKPSPSPDIDGAFIYHDKNQIIYAPLFSRLGYIIPKGKIDRFYNYTQRTMVSIFIALATVVLLGRNIFDGFCVGFIIYMGWSIYFSISFLRNLDTVEHFERTKKDHYLLRLSKKYTKSTFLGLIISSVFFIGILGLYTLTGTLDETTKLTNCILIMGVSGFAVIQLLGLVVQLKAKKD